MQPISEFCCRLHSSQSPKSQGCRSYSLARLVILCLVYAGIYLNSGVTASALAFIRYTGHLTSSARVLLLTDPTSWPYRIFHGENLSVEHLSSDQKIELMINFGLKKSIRPAWHVLLYVFYTGSGFTFASLGMWVWLIGATGYFSEAIYLILPLPGQPLWLLLHSRAYA